MGRAWYSRTWGVFMCSACNARYGGEPNDGMTFVEDIDDSSNNLYCENCGTLIDPATGDSSGYHPTDDDCNKYDDYADAARARGETPQTILRWYAAREAR